MTTDPVDLTSIRPLLVQAIRSAVSSVQHSGALEGMALASLNIEVEQARDSQHGHFSCNIALLLAQSVAVTARQLAELIVQHLPQLEYIAKTEVAGPGFINFFLTTTALQSIIPTVLERGAEFGCWDRHQGQRIHIEYVSANPTGPLHVGHGRSAAFGACVANLLKAVGYEVHQEYYVNDVGRQMGILALSTWLRYLELLDECIVLPPRAYQGDYIIDIARIVKNQYKDKFFCTYKKILADLPNIMHSDAPSSFRKTENVESLNPEQHVDAMVKSMQHIIGNEGCERIRQIAFETLLSDIKQDLEEFGVVHDSWFRESRLFELGLFEKGIALLKAHGHVFEKDGGTWFRASDFGDEQDRVLLRSDGRPTYFAADIAHHLYKYEQGYDHMIDIFGADHHGYVQRIQGFLKGLGRDPSRLDILLVQFAILYRGRQKVPMSTRGGDFVALRQLRAEVGNDASRYFYIMRKPEQHLDFDLELAKSQSQNNPVYYIQYAHARICSVWKQLKSTGYRWDKDNGLAHLDLLTHNKEGKLMHALSQYPEIIFNAAASRAPHLLAIFLQNFAHLFHTYYNDSRFIVEQANIRDARLCLIAAVQQTLKNALQLLGLSAPVAM